MKSRLYLLIAIAVVVMASCAKSPNGNNNTQSAQRFEIHKGLNASHWLSQTEIRGQEREAYMQAKDFANIAQMGFDHVRLPVDEMHLWDENGQRHEEAFKLLHFGIEECIKNNLRVIIDLHVLRSHHFNAANGDGEGANRLWNSPEAQQNFIKFWIQLSAELKQYPNSMVAYEPMNEAVAPNHDDWNKLINWVIGEIRKLEPERTIIMGSNMWQQAATFRYLKVPQGDKNIILSFHDYSPMPFSHYKAPWTSWKKYDGPVQYPGLVVDSANLKGFDEATINAVKPMCSEYNQQKMDENFMKAVHVADSLGLQLYCGEFGCFPTTPLEMRLKWYNDMMTTFKKHNIAFAHWNYKNDFPVVDATTLKPINEIVSILVK